MEKDAPQILACSLRIEAKQTLFALGGMQEPAL